MSEPDWTTHILAGAAWRRFGIMVLLSPVLCCVGFFITFTALFQFFSVLASGETSEHLRRCGIDLSRYATAIIDFLTYNTEQRPFPFSRQTAAGGAPPVAEPDPKRSPPQPAKKKPASRKTATRKRSTRKSTSRSKTTAAKKTSTSEATKKAPAPADKSSDSD